VWQLLLRVLGTIELWNARRRISAITPRHQAVLAALAVRVGRVVSVEQLVDDIWEERPPSSARQQVQNLVAATRRSFRAAGLPGDLLQTRFPGYTLDISDDMIDSRQFEARVSEARDEARQQRSTDAVQAFRQGLALWRGPAFQGVRGRAVRAEAERLDEVRLAALEECIDLELVRGDPRRLVAELRGFTVAYPLRERVYTQLMLALYRSGRQGEALVVYSRARRVLADEVGIDPGAELQRLAGAILRQDVAVSATGGRPASDR
jgi:DNA-binding SARP family transcriptional activator